MKKVRIKTPKVWEPPPNSWSQALRTGNHVYIAGQTATNAKGKMVGKGDAFLQAKQVFRNIKALVEKAGGRNAEAVRKARGEFMKGDPPTSTLLCVTGLASPDYLVEIEAIAVLP
jgi:enamine deaminase RidA (YjgF/YER057c/UK114 family)